MEQADGTMRAVPAYLIEVEWIGGPVTADALEANRQVFMIGAGLLRGNELHIDYGPALTVEIR